MYAHFERTNTTNSTAPPIPRTLRLKPRISKIGTATADNTTYATTPVRLQNQIATAESKRRNEIEVNVTTAQTGIVAVIFGQAAI
jgi:hypothetical protein